MKIYSIATGLFVEVTVFVCQNSINHLSVSESLTYVAVVDSSSLYLFDWLNGSTQEWKKILSKSPQLVRIHPNSMDYFLVGYAGAADTGGFLGYDRPIDLQTYEADIRQTLIASMEINASSDHIVIGGFTGKWSVFTDLMCYPTCYTCTSPSSNSCSYCEDPKQLNSETVGSCKICDKSTHFMSKASTPFLCTICNKACNGCTGSSDSDCLSCAQGYDLENGVCQKQCPNNQFRTSDSNCNLCPSECSSGCLDITGACRPTSNVIITYSFNL